MNMANIAGVDDKVLDLLVAISFNPEEDIRQYGSIPIELDHIISSIAKSGTLPYDWKYLKPLFCWKICTVLDGYFRSYGFLGPITETFEGRRHEITNMLESYRVEAPFTIQRIAEILENPSPQYLKTHKLMNALSRLLLVLSTVSSFN